MTHGRLVQAIYSLLIAFGFSTYSLAATFVWDEHVDEWDDPAKWAITIGSDADGIPDADDFVFIGDEFDNDEVDVIGTHAAAALTISTGGITMIDDAVDINNNSQLSIHGGGILNDGTIFLNSTGSNTTLNFQGTGPGGIPQVIAGRGEIVMSDRTNNRILTNNVVIQHGNGFGHEIRGSGQILQDTGGMINKGTIRAEGNTALVIDPNGLGFVNDNGGLFAAANSTLRLLNGTFTQINFGGITTLDSTAVVELSGATIVGGTIGGIGTTTAVNTTLDNVVIQNNVTYQNNNNTQTTIINGLQLDGLLELNSTGSNTTLFFNLGAQSLSGSGEVVMSDRNNNRILNDNTVTTVESGITIRGAGQILQDTGGMINNGTILAQGATRQLVIDANGLGFDNNGTLRAEGAAGLKIQNTTVQLDGGNSIDVDAGSALDITGSILNNGTLNIADPESANLVTSTFDNMTVNGKVHNSNNSQTEIRNGLTLNGAWNLNSSGSNTTLFFNLGNQTITGDGEVVMTDQNNNRILNSNTITTVDSDITIRGAGQILQDTGGMINNGTILAQGVTRQLVIDANGLGFDNNGTLRAEGAAGLKIQNTVVQLDGGNSIDVDTGSALEIVGSTLNNGTLNIASPVSASLVTSTFDNMTINGTVHNSNNSQTTIVNGVTLNGTWNLNSTASNTTLFFNLGNQTLTGTGEVVMTDKANNRILNSNSITTIDSDITIRGSGQILQDTGGMINNGTILAQGATRQLVIDANGLGFDNNGTLRAEGAAGLLIQNTTVDLDGGNSIDVNAGSALDITGSRLNNGTLNIADPVSANLVTSTFDNMTINGTVHNGNNTQTAIENGVTLNGTWNLNSTSSNTTLLFNLGNQTLTGAGEVVMTDKANNRIINTNSVTTIDSGVTVRGSGQILQDTGGMINNGTILAEGADHQLVIDANGLGFDNNGTLRADGAAGLRIQNSVVALDNGNSIDVSAGSALDVTGSTLNNGALNIADPVSANLVTSTLNNMTINGKVHNNNNTMTTITNGVTINGDWNLNSTGSNTTLFFNLADQLIDGAGEIVMSDQNNNRILNSNTVTTVGSGITIRGAGQLLQDTGGMINTGTIRADGTKAIAINANAKGFSNLGRLHAQGSGGLSFQEGYTQTGAASVTDVDSTLTIVSGTAAINDGTLQGSGTINGNVSVAGNGTVNPGDSPGTLTVNGTYSQGAGGTYLVEMESLASFDVLDVNGTANLGGTLDIALLGGYLPSVGDTFDVLFASTIIGTFSNSTVSVGSGLFSISYLTGGADDIVRLETIVAPVPLPASVWMLLAAIASLVVRRRIVH